MRKLDWMQLTKNALISVCWMKRPRCHHEIYDVVVHYFVKKYIHFSTF